jgi:hypothetical protein
MAETEDSPIILEATEPLMVNASLEDAKKADLPIMNAVVAAVYASWPNVKSIDSLCKMVKATNEAIEGRRKVLGLPYGSENKAPADKTIPGFFSPVD